jgi:hypothetical protein
MSYCRYWILTSCQPRKARHLRERSPELVVQAHLLIAVVLCPALFEPTHPRELTTEGASQKRSAKRTYAAATRFLRLTCRSATG